uniref:Ribonuclease H protein At1g65750 family n=1 Tax=Cajanus cajan TaxID=3821 RepID=A0A151T2Z8_CAJCA|nr:Putative ribonuclease H protein At1g65750 family [Cajanus cajan]
MRPISLCNVSYKIVTKVVATRLKSIMEDIVGPNRQTTYTIIITQEVIHSMKYKSGKKGWMAIKIDLEKAYDRLNWDFIRETLSNIGLLQKMIELICSNMKVSQEKTGVCFSRNVGWNIKNKINSSLNFQRTDDLGKYLGVQLHHERVSKQKLKIIMVHINRRLNSLKTKSFSFTGRRTLSKSILVALPLYTMQTVFFPKQLYDDIDKSSRSFIWGEDGHNQHIHALAWETLCKPKDGGGLGLREAHKVNLSFMMKNCWALCSQPNKIWVQVLQSKYVWRRYDYGDP